MLVYFRDRHSVNLLKVAYMFSTVQFYLLHHLCKWKSENFDFIQCIGATTLDEYRKHIEKDPALERRFQPVKVPEPTVDETIQILKGLRERYEIHHKLRYTDESLVAAAELSHQYIRYICCFSLYYSPDDFVCLLDLAITVVRVRPG